MTFLCKCIEDGFWVEMTYISVYWRWLLHRWACMWNLYIVKKWVIDVHGAKKNAVPQGAPAKSSVICQPCLMTVRIYRIYHNIWSPKIHLKFHLIYHDISHFSYFFFMIIQISMEIPVEIPHFFHGEPPMGNSPRPSASLGPGVARYRAWIHGGWSTMVMALGCFTHGKPFSKPEQTT